MGEVPGQGLRGCDRPLCEVYDTAILDLDGVVYVGRQAVAGAPQTLAQARDAGLHLAFVTNNASRTPDTVARHLAELGVPTEQADVVTSAQAAARLLARLVPPGSSVLVVGGEGLEAAVRERGLSPVRRFEDGVAAVVQGFGRDVGWRDLAEAVVAVRAGLPWVASNLDATFPTARGPAPGNGQLVEVVHRTTGVRPTAVAGKPERALFDETVERVGARRPLVVGDRLDTDIAGAVAAGLDSLLVLTGVTGVAELCAAGPGERPTYLAHNLQGLLSVHPEVVVRRDGGTLRARCGAWASEVRDGTLHLVPANAAAADVASDEAADEAGRDDALRALAAACWAYGDQDTGGAPAGAAEQAWRSRFPSVPDATVEPTNRIEQGSAR